VQDELKSPLDQNAPAPAPKEGNLSGDEQEVPPEDQRVTMWNRRKRIIIKGWKAPMQKHMQKFLGKYPDCEVYDGQDERDEEATTAAANATDSHDNGRDKAEAETEAAEDEDDEDDEDDDDAEAAEAAQGVVKTDPKKGIWCSDDPMQCKVCRAGVGWCKNRGKAGHLLNPGEQEEAPAPSSMRTSSKRSTRTTPAASESAASASSGDSAPAQHLSRREMKRLEQERMQARREWSTQMILLQWGAEMESLDRVDRVARNLTGRWARGASDGWEKTLKTPTPAESAAQLKASKEKVLSMQQEAERKQEEKMDEK
jgi:hypothetical protein